MSLKPSVIREISQRNKDLTFGYLKEKEKENKSNYTQLIKYLILSYSNTRDEFDPEATHKDLAINKNYVSLNTQVNFMGNSYLKNTVNTGNHVWKFKYLVDYENCYEDEDDYIEAIIGIWKTKSDNPSLDASIDDTDNDNVSTGYFIRSDGRKSNPEDNWDDQIVVPGMEITNGDIVEMRLDFKELTLTFKINQEFKMQFTDIENTAYRAAVSFFTQNGSGKLDITELGLTLMSYQDYY